MMPKNGYNYDRLKVSLEQALSVLGERSKQILMLYMTEHYGISFDKKGCSVAEIESALKAVFGSGSSIITERMYKELWSMTE
jgi:hypothetical protein